MPEPISEPAREIWYLGSEDAAQAAGNAASSDVEPPTSPCRLGQAEEVAEETAVEAGNQAEPEPEVQLPSLKLRWSRRSISAGG